MEYRILGSLEAWNGGRELSLGGLKPRALLALLLLHANELVPADRLIDELWGEDSPEDAPAALRVNVSRLRKALPRDVLMTRSPGYVLRVEPDTLDLHRFERLVDEGRSLLARGSGGDASDRIREALSLWRGPALADFAYESFAQAAIARLEEIRLAALELRIDADLVVGRHDELVTELEALVAEHPLRERLRSLHILALYRSGRQAEALEAYRRVRSLLVTELGLEPGPELQQLERRILSHDPALQAPVTARRSLIFQVGDEDFSPLRSLSQSHFTLQPTELVGRASELDDARRLVRDQGIRLLTFVGPPGVGKTRLAMQLASELTEEFEDGVFLVGLAPVTDPALVENAIAQTVGVRGVFEDYFGGRRALLVVDNFEHLLAAAPLIAHLLAAAPRLRVVATSREPLHLTGERQFPVLPLPLDDASQLFVARARDVGCELEPDEVVADVCRRLDRLPLAIELAAARTKLLSPKALLARLERRLPLLTGGARDLPERQRALRVTIEWSYALLNEEERGLFARLAVFAGGCTLEAAEEVCEGTLDQLTSLVDKSLVLLDDDRLSLHETIREYAWERLQSSGHSRVRQRHAEYFLELFEADFEENLREENVGGATLAGQERDNARAALAYFRDAGERERMARLAGALSRFWEQVSPREGRSMLEELPADEELPRDVRARALWAAAGVAGAEGDLRREKSFLDEAITLFRQLGDRPSLAAALMRLGGVAVHEGDYRRAQELLEKSRQLAVELGSTKRLAGITNIMAHIPLYRGDYRQARVLFEDALAECQSFGDARASSMVLGNLGQLALAENRAEDAVAFFKESLAAATELDPDHILNSLDGLAAVAISHGEAELAARLLGTTEEWRWRIGFAQEPFEADLRARTVSAAEEAVGAKTYTARVEEGRKLTIPEAVDYALRSLE
jgi:predicted ATPase/DNA-binding SARP family transcriptional activator